MDNKPLVNRVPDNKPQDVSTKQGDVLKVNPVNKDTPALEKGHLAESATNSPVVSEDKGLGRHEVVKPVNPFSPAVAVTRQVPDLVKPVNEVMAKNILASPTLSKLPLDGVELLSEIGQLLKVSGADSSSQIRALAGIQALLQEKKVI